MSEKIHTAKEVSAALLKHSKEKLEAAAVQIKDMRSRELRKSARTPGSKKLVKAELCLLCGNLDRPGSCTCVLRKDEDGAKSKACPHCSKDVSVVDGKIGHHFEGRQAKPCKGVGCAPKSMEKDEKSPDKAPGAVLPGDKDAKETKAPGSGGKVSKIPGLKKSAALRKSPMDMVMGREKFKAPGTMAPAPLPGMGPVKVNGMHPDTHASLQDAKAARPSPAAASVATANKELGGFKSIASSPVMGGVKPIARGPIAIAANAKAKTAATPPPIPAAARKDEVPHQHYEAGGQVDKGHRAVAARDLAEDKRAAGVGFLSNLITRFKGVGNKTWGQTARTSPRASGVRPLQRSAKPETKKPFSMKKEEMGKCAMCSKMEHDGTCKKLEVPPSTEGLSMTNHNRSLLTLDKSIKPALRQGFKKRKNIMAPTRR